MTEKKSEQDKKMDDLLRRIRALRAKAEKTDNEHEAAAFAAKARQLLAEHDLEEAQLDVSSAPPNDVEHHPSVRDWNQSPARRMLAGAVCRLYDVRALIANKRSDGLILVGRRASIVMVKEMMEYLVTTTIRLSRKWAKENLAPDREMIDFRRGCFDRLRERVLELKQNQDAEKPVYTPRGNPQNLPAVYARDREIVEARVRQLYPSLTRVKQKINVGATGLTHGRAAGDTIGLHRQIEGGGSGGVAGLIGKK